MAGFLRPLAVFGASAALSVALYQLVTVLDDGSTGPTTAVAATNSKMGPYRLTDLRLLDQTIGYVVEAYVDQSRLDWTEMFDASLHSVESMIPAVMFRRVDDRLNLSIGSFRTVLEVGEINSRLQYRREMGRVAALLDEHLRDDQISFENDDLDPRIGIEFALANGALHTLDPHSTLLPPEQSQEMDVDNAGEFGGLGITITLRDGRLTVDYPLADTPASVAGVEPDDRIVRIDGQSTLNMSLEEAVSTLRGPVGAPVTLHILRDGWDEARPFELKRALIRFNAVTGQLLDGGVGYIELPSFNANCAAELRAALVELDKEAGGLKGLILDLRDNPGGYLNQAVSIADAFVSEGELVSTVGPRDGRGKIERARKAGTASDFPIGVLVSANSASASEVVSGALKNNQRAVIVGERTFGKGSVQTLHPMLYGSKLKITIAQYLTPGEKSIQSVGIPADIQLVPSVVERSEDDASVDLTAFYFRERVTREEDLEAHLEHATSEKGDSTWRVRYLRDADWRRKKAGKPDLEHDWSVQFTRKLLAESRAVDRPDVLKGAAKLVKRASAEEDKDIVAAFGELDIDWRQGPAVESADLDVDIHVKDGDHLSAGIDGVITITVTNRGDKPLYRLSAVGVDHDLLEGREAMFGYIPPGGSATHTRKIIVDDGYPTETAPVSFEFRDTSEKAVATASAPLRVVETGRPEFEWTLTPEIEGEWQPGTVKIRLDVSNVGSGASTEGVARLRNLSGKALDLNVGTLEFGGMVNEDGSVCEPSEPGVEFGITVGDPKSERVATGEPPVYPKECHRELAAGETWSGWFEVVLADSGDKPWEMQLTLGDAVGYDYASIYRNGFYGWFMQTHDIEVAAGTPAQPFADKPPMVEITRRPDEVVEFGSLVISGRVTDDTGIEDVMIFVDDDKVFYQGAPAEGAIDTIPFSADLDLEPGLHTISVLARDVDGLTRSASAVTWVKEAETTAAVPSADAPVVE